MPHPLFIKVRMAPGKGKQVVLIASDHESKPEEALPQLARILGKRAPDVNPSDLAGWNTTILPATVPAR